MDERLHQALDDEMAAGALPAAVVAELDQTRALFGAVLRAIPAPPLPKLGSAVLQRIDAIESSTFAKTPQGRASEWLWSSHRLSVSIRPVYAIAAAVLLAAVIGIQITDRERGREPSVVASAAKVEVLVHFTLDAPQARAVSLAGDFSNWHPSYTLQRSASGTWTVVIPLTPGVHDYSFVIDGARWLPDPAATPIADGFGGTNSRIAVLGPDKRT